MSSTQIKEGIIKWFHDHPMARAIASGSLESIPVGGPILRNIFERSTKSEEDKTKLIIETLKNLEKATDKQIENFFNKLRWVEPAYANTDLLEESVEISSRMLNLSEEANIGIKELNKKFDFLLQKSEQAKDNLWLQFDIALGAMEELFKGHVKLIDQAIAPILEERENGLQTTAKMFRTLVFNDELPTGYEKAHAHLNSWVQMEEFRDEVNSTRINAVRTELSVFQYAVFPLMSQSGYLGDFGFGSASKLWSLLTKNSGQDAEKEKLQKNVRENFLCAFHWLSEERSWHESHGRKVVKPPFTEEEYEKLLDISQLDKPDGVVKIVSEWCRGWQYLVKQQLWNNNLQNAITQLRYAKFNQKAG